MQREYYSDSIANFRETSPNEILGILAKNNEFPLEQTQRDAWLEEINILRKVLLHVEGAISVNQNSLHMRMTRYGIMHLI